MPDSYATLRSLQSLGLPASAFVAAARPLEDANTSTGVLTLTGHSLLAEDPLRFTLESSSIPGETPAALMGGISASTLYYAAPVSSDLFKVSTTAGGATIDSFSSAPVGLVGVAPDPVPKLLAILAERSGYVRARSIAYKGGFVQTDGAWPDALEGLVARMAARDALVIFGLQNPVYAASAKAVMDRADEDKALLIDASMGKLVFGPALTATPNPVRSGARSWSSATDGAGANDWLNVAGGGLLS